MRANAGVVLLILMTVWAGIVIGVSLIAAPIKFQAPSLTMQTGVETGRHTFRFLAQIELCFLVAVVAAAGLAQPRWTTGIPCLSIYHRVYAVIEAAKATLPISGAVVEYRSHLG